MKNATPQVGRPRTITTEKLDSLMEAAKKMNGSLTKACRSQHKNYQSVLNAATTLGPYSRSSHQPKPSSAAYSSVSTGIACRGTLSFRDWSSIV